MTTHPSVSIALLTRNGEGTLPALLDAIWRQKTARAIEVIAIDSGSTDRTREVLDGRVANVVAIEPKAFNHGLTRNLAVSHATNELVVFIVQDALPADEHWLEALVAPLDDPTVAGAFARQRPRSDASALTRYYLARYAGAGPRGWTAEVASQAAWALLTPAERFDRCVFDNVCSCIRRSVWMNKPFNTTPIAEDMEWSRDVLLAGHRIVYAPAAVVEHSHERGLRYEYQRTYVLHRRLYELFGLQTIPSLALATRATASSVARHLWCERAEPSAWGRAIGLGVVWPAAQYRGARAAARGATPPAWKPGAV